MCVRVSVYIGLCVYNVFVCVSVHVDLHVSVSGWCVLVCASVCVCECV